MSNSHPEPKFPASVFIKRCTLVGAGLGMLGGLIYLGLTGADAKSERASIGLWRNAILIGAATGLVIGILIAWRIRFLYPPENSDL